MEEILDAVFSVRSMSRLYKKDHQEVGSRQPRVEVRNQQLAKESSVVLLDLATKQRPVNKENTLSVL